MRTRTAGLVIGIAAALGLATGAVIIPDRDAVVAGPADSPASTRTPTSTPSRSPSPKPTPTIPGEAPVRAENLLTTADFRSVGLTAAARRSDSRLELPSCTTEHLTLADLAGSGPPVQQVWEGGTLAASEQAVAMQQPEEVQDVSARLVAFFEDCQRRPAGTWVYGPTHTEKLDGQTTAIWLGSVDGDLNVDRKAPKDRDKINGGVAVLHRGLHVGVLVINMCASAGDEPACTVASGDPYGQLSALGRAAARRLG